LLHNNILRQTLSKVDPAAVTACFGVHSKKTIRANALVIFRISRSKLVLQILYFNFQPGFETNVHLKIYIAILIQLRRRMFLLWTKKAILLWRDAHSKNTGDIWKDSRAGSEPSLEKVEILRPTAVQENIKYSFASFLLCITAGTHFAAQHTTFSLNVTAS